ncbi:MAG: cytochrome c [Geminicoccaceae bacterium]|nr:cytochrome c [Geminicoccaceae bacterium]
MKAIIAAVAIAALGVGAAFAQADAIKQRQQIMEKVGKATGAAGKMLKGEAKFDLATAQATLDTYVEATRTFGGLFPENSRTGNDTEALPAIWEKKAEFDAKLAKLGADATAAKAAIKDEASFKATMPGVMKNCGGCHETFRAKKS